MQVLEAEASEQIRQNREAIEAIESNVPDREVQFNWIDPGGKPVVATYIQAELGMFPTQEFAQMVTEVVNSFVQGEMGMKIGDLFRGDVSLPQNFDAEAVDTVVDENIEIIKALIQLIRILPGLQLDIICLSLGVPRRRREWAKEQMQEPPHRGGLTVDQGFDLLITFIKQNADLLRETFLGKAQELVDVFRLHVMKEDPTKETKTSPEEETPRQPDSPGTTPSSISSPPIKESD